MTTFIKWFREIRLEDVPRVGGKTASLGELYGELGAAGVRVPARFEVPADAYRALLDGNGLRDRLAAILEGVTGEGVTALAAAGAELRGLVESAPLPAGLEDAIVSAYRTLARESGSDRPAVAVRSSATAEDLPPERVLDLQAGAAGRSPRPAQAEDRPEDVEARHGSRRADRAGSGARRSPALRQPQ